MVQKALKELVLDGFVMPSEISSRIVFQITADGKKYCNSLENDYAREYRAIAEKCPYFKPFYALPPQKSQMGFVSKTPLR